MRRMFTVEEAQQHGVTAAQLRWGTQAGKWQLVIRGVYIVGSQPATTLECAAAVVIVTAGVAIAALAGVLWELDSVVLRPPYAAVEPTKSGRRGTVRRRSLRSDCIVIVQGIRCTD